MKIKWTDPSVRDLENIYEYIKKDSEYYAAIFVEKIIKAPEILVKYPEIGRIVPEYEEETLRELIISPYRIIYRINIDFVSILTVIHSSRDLEQIDLKE